MVNDAVEQLHKSVTDGLNAGTLPNAEQLQELQRSRQESPVGSDTRNRIEQLQKRIHDEIEVREKTGADHRALREALGPLPAAPGSAPSQPEFVQPVDQQQSSLDPGLKHPYLGHAFALVTTYLGLRAAWKFLNAPWETTKSGLKLAAAVAAGSFAYNKINWREVGDWLKSWLPGGAAVQQNEKTKKEVDEKQKVQAEVTKEIGSQLASLPNGPLLRNPPGPPLVFRGHEVTLGPAAIFVRRISDNARFRVDMHAIINGAEYELNPSHLDKGATIRFTQTSPAIQKAGAGIFGLNNLLQVGATPSLIAPKLATAFLGFPNSFSDGRIKITFVPA